MDYPHDPDRIALLDARDDAEHWERPHQELRNALPIPPRGRQHDCDVAVRAHLVWADDGPQQVETIAYAWSASPRCVLVQVDDRRYHCGGAWLPPWDVQPAKGTGQLWTNRWGGILDAPPWDG